MAKLIEVIKAVGEWVEVEPRGLFEKVFGRIEAERRDKEIRETREEFEVLKKEAEMVEWESKWDT